MTKNPCAAEPNSPPERSREDASPELSARLEEAIRSADAGTLRKAAADPCLGEDLALALLSRRDLPADVIEALAKNPSAGGQRKVMQAIVRHPRTPRHVAFSLVRRLYVFELLQLILLPDLAADLRVAMEELLLTHRETISSGQRVTLAHRGSGTIAASLLNDPEERVIHAALENPRMTESHIVRALMRHDAREALLLAVCRHPKWKLRQDVRLALLRHPRIPLGQALAIVQSLPLPALQEALQRSSMDPRIRAYLVAELERRERQSRQTAKSDGTFPLLS